MSNNLLGISVSGLRVAQTSLNTTGHNISNAGVDGYSRQRVLAETNPARLQAHGYIGSGANVQSVERVANEFINSQLRVDSSLFKDLDLYYNNVAQLDVLLSDVSTGLSAGLESFYAAVQNGADDPTSIPARQLIISEAENLSDRFNTIFSRLQDTEESIDEQIETSVSRINALSRNIAELNLKVSNAMGNGAMPNDLMDQRDEALRQLSEIVSIQTFDEGIGMVNVIVGSGQNLVVGAEARQLAVVKNEDDPTSSDLMFVGGQGAPSGVIVTDLVSGGELGGLIRFRDDALEDVYNELGRVAISLAATVNDTHQMGITLNNDYGGDFFANVNDPTVARNRVISNGQNAAPNDRQLSLNINDVSQLMSSDYNVEVKDGGLFTISRASDGEQVFRGNLTGNYPQTVSFDGLELSFDSGTFQSGDKFLIQPFKNGARDFASALVNPEDIAFGSPLLTDSHIGNQGSGAITAGEVLSLLDSNGVDIPLLSTPGEMNPPLLVNFTTPTTYEILDNSDPGNPVDLDPPIRNQTFVVGGTNALFNTDPGATMVSTEGDMIGLPEGRRAATNASIQFSSPPAAAPDFTVTDFSAPANQFSFDVVVSNVPGVAPATYTVNIDGNAITDENALLMEINTHLTGTDARAYIADNGTLAFRLNTPGYGDIAVQNYTAAGAPAGQANALLGFDIEGGNFTTVGDADGFSGDGSLTNGYPAEAITITRPAENRGATPTTYNIFTGLNASAKETASQLNNIDGVQANAFNYVELSNIQATRSVPLQVELNGVNLVDYGVDSVTGDTIIANGVPDPQLDEAGFYDYLAEQINENPSLAAQGIHAVSGTNAQTGANELRVYDTQGNDFNLGFTAATGQSFDVSDGENPNLTLAATGVGTATSIVVGGRIDVTMEDSLSLSTFPANSMLFGNTAADDFAKTTYYGIQAQINGIPEQGDRFTLDFNQDAAMDNRNALALSEIENTRIMNGGVSSIGESYSALVEDVGIDTASTKINLDASEQVLEQSTERRNSISGVNLDEEAANLIKFEQLYSANAQVISVARDIFDRLISAF